MQIFKYILVLAGAISGIAVNAQTAESLLEEAEQAYLEYNFNEASRLLSTAQKKIGKKNDALLPRIDDLKQQILTAKGFMERVEQIEILDSICVPKDMFFNVYRLPASAGHLHSGDALQSSDEQTDYLFTNEKENYRLWSAPDTTGYFVLREQTRLTDGSWSEVHTLSDLSEDDADVRWPFMMSDGVTIYYASDGPESMGGMDIMVATRDGSDGDFLQPQNLGMPYNSPFNDYLLAIDELNGVGWWATDRNQIPDMITIYLYKVNDLRKNYDPDTIDLADKARLRNWQSTQNEEADYTTLLNTISKIDPSKDNKPYDFTLPMDHGRIYHYYSDFRTRAAADLMKKYIAAKKDFDKSESNLQYLRQKYAENSTATLRNRIISEEQSIERKRQSLQQQLSDIYRTERK